MPHLIKLFCLSFLPWHNKLDRFTFANISKQAQQGRSYKALLPVIFTLANISEQTQH